MGFMIFLKYKSNKIKSIDNTMVYFGLSLSMNHFTGNEVIEGRKNRQQNYQSKLTYIANLYDWPRLIQ